MPTGESWANSSSGGSSSKQQHSTAVVNQQSTQQATATTSTAPSTSGPALPSSGGERNQTGKHKSRRIALLHRVGGRGLFDLDTSNLDMDQESLLPNSIRYKLKHQYVPKRSRLYKLFTEIEREFETLYAENLTLQQQIEVLNDKLETATGGKEGQTDGSEADSTQAWKQSVKKSTKHRRRVRFRPHRGIAEDDHYKSISAGSQISQKLKLTYKTSTNKIVSSFRAATSGYQFCREFRGHRDGVWEVNCSKVDPQFIGTASADHSARLWWIENGSCVLNYSGHSGSVNSLRFHPSQELVLTGSGDQTAHIWRATFNKPAVDNARPQNQSSEDELEGSGQEDGAGETALDSSDDKQEPTQMTGALMELTGHCGVVIAADWLAAGQQVITASWDRTANLYDADTGDVITTLTGHDHELTNVCAHQSQSLVVTCSKDTTFRLWDLRDPAMKVNVFQGHTQQVMTAVFAGADRVVSGSDDRTVKVWDLKNMRSPITTIRTDSAVNRLAVHGVHNIIAIPHDNRHIRLYDLNGARTGRLPRSNRQGHSRMVCATAWNEKEGATCNLFSCGFDRHVFGWNVNPHAKE